MIYIPILLFLTFCFSIEDNEPLEEGIWREELVLIKEKKRTEENSEINVYFVRHGQALHNTLGCKNAGRDPPLTDLGHKQSKGVRLDVVPDVVFFSPFMRTIQTMMDILDRYTNFQKKSIAKIPSEFIIVNNAGKGLCGTGSEVDVLYEEFPSLDFSSLRGGWFKPALSHKKRISRFRKTLFLHLEENFEMDNVLVVTHFVTIRRLTGIRRPGNGKVIKCVYSMKTKDFSDCTSQ